VKVHFAINLYVPAATYRRRGVGTLSRGTGCQRVFEPYLSPLLYKSITLSEEFVIEFVLQIKLI